MKQFSIEFKWAINFTIASLVWMVLENVIGLHDAHIDKQLIYTNLFGLVAISLFVFALRDKKKNFYHDHMDWTRGFLAGMVMSVIIACLNPLVQYITYTYISPDYFTHMIDYRVAHHYQTLDKAKAFFNMENFLYKDVIPGLSMGVVTSAIVALFLKSKTAAK